MTVLTRIARQEPFGAAVFYMALFGTYGIFLPFFPVFLAGRGLEETEIAIVLAMPMAMRILFAPATGYVADRLADRRQGLILFTWLACAIFGLLFWARGFTPILAVTIGYAIFWTALVPVIDAITLGLERNKGHNYGRIRLWGSVAFIVTNVGVGSLLQGRDGELVYWLLLAGGAITGLAAFIAPRSTMRNAVEEIAPEVQRPGALKTLTNPIYLAILSAAALIQASHAMVYGFGTLYWAKLGLLGWQIGTLWAIGVIAEIGIFAAADRLLALFGARGLIIIGGLAGVIRWAVFPWVEGFAPFLLLQVLHGLSFGATYLGTVHYISASVPERMAAQAQSSYATLGAVMLAAGTLASGPIYRVFAGQGFALMAPVSLLAVLIVGWAIWTTSRQAATS